MYEQKLLCSKIFVHMGFSLNFHHVNPQFLHLKHLIIFLLKMPSTAAETTLSPTPIFWTLVEEQVGHFGFLITLLLLHYCV